MAEDRPSHMEVPSRDGPARHFDRGRSVALPVRFNHRTWLAVASGTFLVWLLSLGPGLLIQAPGPVPPPDSESGSTALSAPLSVPSPPLLSTWEHPASVAAPPNGWNYVLFSSVCHSRPERSYFLWGRQMAVNSRCTGFFSGLWLATVLLPLAWHRFYGKKWVLFTLLGAVMVQMGDAAGNMAGLWVNTLASRFWLGMALGVALALSLADAYSTRRSAPQDSTPATPGARSTPGSRGTSNPATSTPHPQTPPTQSP